MLVHFLHDAQPAFVKVGPWSSLTQTFLFLHGEVAPSICIAPPGYFTLGSGFTAPARNRQARVHPRCYPARPGLSTHIACHAMIQGDKGCNNACRYIRMQIHLHASKPTWTHLWAPSSQSLGCLCHSHTFLVMPTGPG